MITYINLLDLNGSLGVSLGREVSLMVEPTIGVGWEERNKFKERKNINLLLIFAVRRICL